jgi:XTP/dITP diphosphohydrolase
MIVYVATKNAGKLRELEALFAGEAAGAGAKFELRTFDGYEDPLEGDVSYADNAALKAHALRAQLERAGIAGHVLADDSGLEVYALDRRPGVLTAYYGGADLPWPERRRRLLEELNAAGATDRRARFVCSLHFISSEGRELACLGTVEGEIPTEERGDVGFSFDPVFLYPRFKSTFAELTDEQKNCVSHRAVAVSGLVAAMYRAGMLV